MRNLLTYAAGRKQEQKKVTKISRTKKKLRARAGCSEDIYM
jgi:hypothetical protein